MVCTGNICRSPAMHYWSQSRWESAALVSSAGIYAEVGLDATSQTRRAAERYGLAMPRHRPTQLDRDVVNGADLVLVATDQHARWIVRELGQQPSHVFGLHEAADLAEFAPAPTGDSSADRLRGASAVLDRQRTTTPLPRRSLDDPWGLDQATHDRVMDEIVDAIDILTTWGGLDQA